MRSKPTSAGSLDVWHLAEKYNSCPKLSPQFIRDNPPIDRISRTTAAFTHQFIADIDFDEKAILPLPMYNIPGVSKI